LAPLTRRIAYLEEGDWAELNDEGARFHDAQHRPVEREIRVTALTGAATGKGNYRHFMEKELHEHPAVLGDTLRQYLDPKTLEVRLPRLPFDPARVPRLTITACGSAFLAGLVGRYWIEKLARLPVDADVASELRYRDPPLAEVGGAILVSQSGETADTLAALRHCKREGQTIAVVVNVPTSSMAREADLLLPTHAGPEIGVASTKAFTCQLAVLAALAAHLAVCRGRLSRDEEREIVAHLIEAPAALNAALAHDAEIAAMAHLIAPARDVLYLGRGPDYPLALEGALKLKEISYIHAEGYASGEMKHGPIALIDEAVPVIVLAPSGPLFEKTVSNMQEVRARGGKIVLVSDKAGLDEAGEGCLATIEMPAVHPLIAPLVYAVPVQLLAYHVAVAKGTDVDQPRNLAKSVTVE
jgi:glutamine---fructose-6-phosphate transaminase (isomerizing)